LLAPRRIAFIGGRIAEMAIGRCRDVGFDGEILAVNPTRETLAGVRCYPSVEALPATPDAAYVGVNRLASIEVVRSLAARGAGGCVCYAAGFAEVGEEGHGLQARLVEAACGMPLIGPNCFGFVNYVDRCALWPYLYGGAPVDRGVALISQSGNVAMNLTMNERSVRFTHVICGGNQAVLGPSDFLDTLLEDVRVRAVGLVIEGLDDLDAFARCSQRALDRGVPIVAMKVGRTPAGAERASSHTSSLTGSDALYDAYFARLGVIRVESLPRLLETLKLFDVCDPLPGEDIVTLSCSGGEATLLADLSVQYGLKTSPFTPSQTQDLYALFPGYVTVSNPFDYNTSIWGDKDAMRRCFTLSLSGTHQAAVLVDDHPTVEADEVAEWVDALDAFIDAHRATGMPAIVVCTISELLPRALRERLIAAGVAPMQGLDDALFALAAAARYVRRRSSLATAVLPRIAAPRPPHEDEGECLDEWHAKQRLAAAGVEVPAGRLGGYPALGEMAAALGFPLVLKACGVSFLHKSEQGAVRLGLRSGDEVEDAAQKILAAARAHGLTVESFLLERMIEDGVAELIVGIHVDPQFGPTLIVGSGGILVELVGDSVSLLLPTDRETVTRALESLRVHALLRGFRGKPPGDIAAAVDAVLRVARFAELHWESIRELDVNPLIIRPEGRGAIAVDALLRLSEAT
jgi:acyl-CoA synthetase (NDP forming)